MFRSSGIGTYLQNLVPRLLEAGLELRFTLLGKRADLSNCSWFTPEKAELVPCASRIYSVAEQIELPRKIPRDTALFWTPHYIIPVAYGGRLLATVHDVFHLAMPKLTGGLHKRFYARAIFSALRRKASGIICVSRFTKEEFLRHAGPTRAELTVIYNGVEPRWFQIEKNGPPHPRPYLLFVGNIKPHKNLPRLIQAFALLKDQIPHDLVLVGQAEGFITGDANAFRAAEGLGGRVVFTGALAHESPALRQYYAHASLLASPSLYESFCLPAMEALAAGCPVLVSNVAAFPEIYQDAAAYCNPYDVPDISRQLLSLLQNETLRARLREKGRQIARNFSWDKAAAETSAVIQRLLA